MEVVERQAMLEEQQERRLGEQQQLHKHDEGCEQKLEQPAENIRQYATNDNGPIITDSKIFRQ